MLPESVAAFLAWARTGDGWGGLLVGAIIIGAVAQPWLLAGALLRGVFFSVSASNALKDPTNPNPLLSVGPSMVVEFTRACAKPAHLAPWVCSSRAFSGHMNLTLPLVVMAGRNGTYSDFWADQYMLPVPDILICLSWALAAFEILWGIISILLAPGWVEAGCEDPFWRSWFDNRLRKIFIVFGILTFYLGLLLLVSLWLWGKQTADDYNDFIRNANFTNTGVSTPVPQRIASNYLSGLQLLIAWAIIFVLTWILVCILLDKSEETAATPDSNKEYIERMIEKFTNGTNDGRAGGGGGGGT